MENSIYILLHVIGYYSLKETAIEVVETTKLFDVSLFDFFESTRKIKVPNCQETKYVIASEKNYPYKNYVIKENLEDILEKITVEKLRYKKEFDALIVELSELKKIISDGFDKLTPKVMISVTQHHNGCLKIINANDYDFEEIVQLEEHLTKATNKENSEVILIQERIDEILKKIQEA